jgi:hypothetical protein
MKFVLNNKSVSVAEGLQEFYEEPKSFQDAPPLPPKSVATDEAGWVYRVGRDVTPPHVIYSPEPATKDGKPVAVEPMVQVDFRLYRFCSITLIILGLS